MGSIVHASGKAGRDRRQGRQGVEGEYGGKWRDPRTRFRAEHGLQAGPRGSGGHFRDRAVQVPARVGAPPEAAISCTAAVSTHPDRLHRHGLPHWHAVQIPHRARRVAVSAQQRPGPATGLVRGLAGRPFASAEGLALARCGSCHVRRRRLRVRGWWRMPRRSAGRAGAAAEKSTPTRRLCLRRAFAEPQCQRRAFAKRLPAVGVRCRRRARRPLHKRRAAERREAGGGDAPPAHRGELGLVM
mmetsp:Transcript_109993/g.316600  ORF Transcript_109993/g.316600 Transcript_109993/m.316600 type:complete len:243 (+) Transcript_109993:578-1306(+)